MEVVEAIHHRRSIGKMLDRQPEKEKIEQILECARWAPNHHKTEPWHFYVLIGKGREKLGRAYGKINVEKLNHPTEEKKRLAMESGLKKAKRAPVVIVNVVEPDSREHIEWVEEVAACACAVQNMLLTAHALGLSAMWRTGKPNYHRVMKETFGVSENGMILGFLYIGYPAVQKPATPKKAVEEYTTWVTE